MSKLSAIVTDANLALASLKVEDLSISDQLQDNKTRLENTLKTQLSLPVSEANIELIQSIINLLLNDFKQNQAGLSNNTINSLYYNWACFYDWCKSRDISPLPASTAHFVEFMQDMKSKVKLNTLASYRWAINSFHLAAGLPSPTNPRISIDTFSGIRKEKARASELITQASPFRHKHLDFLISHWNDSNLLIKRRDLAVLTIAYESMLRETELANIKFDHLTFQEDGRATLLVPVSKTNHSGHPDIVMLSKQCVNILWAYLKCCSHKKGYIFKQIKRNDTLMYGPNPLTRLTIDRVFKRAHQFFSAHSASINLMDKAWSGHSARVGACQDLLSAGYSILEVQQAGRWSSPMMVYRYGRNVLAKESAMAKARWHR